MTIDEGYSLSVDLKHGNYTGLAGNYARFRPGYAPHVATAVLGYVGRAAASIDAADIGAGTGIWTRALAARGVHSLVAVEPNDEMRGQGIETSRGTDIAWFKGSAEATGLPDGSVDLVSMASSLHWADFDKACEEFHRILRPGGVFVALWNPRFIEANPLLVEIEAEIARLKPDIRRVSSGRSGITDRLTDMLSAKPQFAEVLYLEGRHSAHQTPGADPSEGDTIAVIRIHVGLDLENERRHAGLGSRHDPFVGCLCSRRRRQFAQCIQ